MKKLLALFTALIATVALAAGPHIIKNTAQDQDVKILVNDGGTMTTPLNPGGTAA